MSIFLNNSLVEPTFFPDGTSQVWKLEQVVRPYNVVRWEFECESELPHVMQLGMLLASSGMVELYTPYLPYARQDKQVGNDSCFALRLLADVVDLYFDKLTTFDAHNPGFFDDFDFDYENIEPIKEISEAADAVDATVLCYPDAGAASRYGYDFGMKRLVFQKNRDQATGFINGVSVLSGDACEASDVVLIVDDICDGGRTFIEVAKMLPWAKEVHLYVSHGIFSKGTDLLRDAGIQRIFTRNGEVGAEVTSGF